MQKKKSKSKFHMFSLIKILGTSHQLQTSKPALLATSQTYNKPFILTNAIV